MRYVLDWPNDEQPYRMRVPKGELVSIRPCSTWTSLADWHRRVDRLALGSALGDPAAAMIRSYASAGRRTVRWINLPVGKASVSRRSEPSSRTTLIGDRPTLGLVGDPVIGIAAAVLAYIACRRRPWAATAMRLTSSGGQSGKLTLTSTSRGAPLATRRRMMSGAKCKLVSQ